MAAAITYYQSTGTGSPIKLSTIIGRRDFVTDVAIRAGISNAGVFYIGDSATTAAGAAAGAYISARETFTISLAQARVDTERVYFCGTNPDKIFITVIT